MKLTVSRPSEIEVDAIRVEVPVRYGVEDIPQDFPLRVGDMWRGTIDLATGKIREWPQGRSGEMHMKVVDQGIYTLFSGGKEVACLNEDYCPNSIIPGDYGDYINLDIDATGLIVNWRKPSAEAIAKAFFGEDD